MKQFILCILALFLFVSCKDYSHVEKFPYPEYIEVGELVYRRDPQFKENYFLDKHPEDLVVFAVSKNNNKIMRALRNSIRKQFPNNVIEFGRFDKSITHITIYDQYNELYAGKIRPAADKMFLQYIK